MWNFLADPHLGHANIIKYCKRPFLSQEEETLLSLADKGLIPHKEVVISQESTNKMTDTIINSINAIVDKNDSLVIAGDFCWTPKKNALEVARSYRDRINCKNIYLIWGNHDNRRMEPLFKACFEQYMFNVDGQNIFVNHYPSRSWDQAHYGAWHVYGHVHNKLWSEDNGKLLPYEHKVISDGFNSVLEKYGIQDPNLTQELLNVCESTKGVNLTIDVGVDNVRENVPFGTPWSMDDLREYMKKKLPLWEKRQSEFKNFRPSK